MYKYTGVLNWKAVPVYKTFFMFNSAEQGEILNARKYKNI